MGAEQRGSRFSAVANEVRELAELSQTAAREIRGLAGSSMDVAERSGKLLRGLLPAIRKTSDSMRDVATASSQQSHGVSEVSKAMTVVNQVTRQTESTVAEQAGIAGKSPEPRRDETGIVNC